MTKPTYRIVSRIFEGSDDHPVLVHVFYGRTLDVAARVFSAHQKTDKFLSACMRSGFGKINCREEHESQTLKAGRWVRI